MHPTTCFKRADEDVYDGNNLLDFFEVTAGTYMIEVRCRGRKGEQARVGSTAFRTRAKVSGLRSGLISDTAAVAIVVEWLSCGAVLLDHTSVLVPV